MYPIHICVAYSSDKDKRLEYFRKILKEPEFYFTESHESSASIAVFKKYLLFEFEPDPERSAEQLAGLVAHEACHATYFIQEKIGNIFNNDIQEPQCYFIQYLTQLILERIWEHLHGSRKKEKR